jgi:hypothetical protein
VFHGKVSIFNSCRFVVSPVVQAYDNIIRSRWKRRTSNDSRTFSLSESCSKIDWDVFMRVIGEHPSNAAAAAETLGTTSSAVSTSSASGYQAVPGHYNDTSSPVQCWECLKYGHTKPYCPTLVKPVKGFGKGQGKAPHAGVPAAAAYPAITNGGLGDGGKGVGKEGGKFGKGKKGKQLANNVAAVFARPR